ncbi:MAG TPA: DUF4129 domain-containing protein [Candidatus Limnocylindrales bacterium]
MADTEDEAPPSGATRIPGWVALPAAAGLIALVALTSRSQATGTSTGPIGLESGITVLEVIGYVFLAIGIAVLPIIAVAHGRARQMRMAAAAAQPKRPPAPWWANLLGAVVVIPLIVFQVAIILNFIIELLQRRADEGTGIGGLLQDVVGRLDPSRADSPALGIAMVIVIVIFLVVVGLLIRWRLTDTRGKRIDRGRAASTVAAVEVSLEAIRREPDPRRAVIAAYAAMERSLAHEGYPREESEAPLEYLRRVLAASTHAVDEVRTLTLLFQHAKFSDHAVDETMRSGAITALERIRTAASASA